MNPELVVSTSSGKICGAKTITKTTKITYYKFCGIPYVQPPIGPLRFMPPKPVQKWSKTLDGTKEGNDCLQFALFVGEIVGSEDCLYLNVYTPEPPSKIATLKPVIIEIHTGGHFWGSSSQKCFGDPDYVMDKDIIFVNFNYRLHILGFLNLDLPNCSGNMGLKDQQAALQWIKSNIKYFGGDPDNLTLYGNSSSSCDVHFHMMNPISQKLFHRAIMQCGYALNPCWSYQENHVERAMEFAHFMGFKGNKPKNLLIFLKRQEESVLMHSVLAFKKFKMMQNRAKFETCVFLPTIEIPQENAFLTQSPRELIYLTPSKPMICGITSKEGALAFCENLWMYKMIEETLDYVCQELRNFDFENVSKINGIMSEEIADLYTDMWYNEWHKWIDHMASNSESIPVYLYHFDYEGVLNIQKRISMKIGEVPIKGACHADDGAYFMMYSASKGTSSIKDMKTDWMMVQNMTNLLTNFAKTGNPNCETNPEITWCPYEVNNPSHLLFCDEGVKILPNEINEKRKRFWNKIIEYIKEHEEDAK